MKKTPYWNLPGFENVYLEDSFVLDIKETSNLIIQIEAVLRETHSDYTPPKANEQYCYRRMEISFPNPKSITWVEKSMKPIKDVTGEVDYGNIDQFYFSEGSFLVKGEWGCIKIVSGSPTLRFT